MIYSMDSPNLIIQDIFSHTTHGIRLGTERISRSAALIGNPQNAFRSVHVAGTNGKGSVCAFMASILRQEGYTTGLYTSPHIRSFEERFIIDGSPVKPEEWVSVYHDIKDKVELSELSFFEITTLIAFELFCRKGVDWAVIETGLGGRLDATNIITPEVAVITRIGIDHTNYLGNDSISIAREKLGIVKNRIPLVIAPQADTRITGLAARICRESDSLFVPVNEHSVTDITATAQGCVFRLDSREYMAPLAGGYQVQNALCAIAAAQIVHIGQESIIRGISDTYLPGRFQTIPYHGRQIIFDVAHNPQAVNEFCTLLKQRYRETAVCLVVGIMADKDTESMITLFAHSAQELVLCRPDIHRAADPNNLAKWIPVNSGVKITIIDSVADAVRYGLEKTNGVIGVSGSFYTVGEAMAALDIHPYDHAR